MAPRSPIVSRIENIYASKRGLFALDTTLFQLNPEYNDIYQMRYITPELVESLDFITTIQVHFDELHMAAYFGDRANLSCKEVRKGYLNLLEYFRPLFTDTIERVMNIDISGLPNNAPTLCLIAECLSIIRASIKKYMRHRTSINQRWCTKSGLNTRNAEKYGCPATTGMYEYCPSFGYLHKIKGKSCKDILISSGRTDEEMTFYSWFADYFSSTPVDGPMHSLPSLPSPVKLRPLKQKNTRRKHHVYKLPPENMQTVNIPLYNANSGASTGLLTYQPIVLRKHWTRKNRT